MADIKPSIDLKKVNLQTAVGYLVSLHENEYEWNLLGIKVVGNVDTVNQLPDSAAEYGDTYAVGTEEPYIFYVWTRADGGVHTSDYWFPLGKFPLPGPQGPKGDGLETVTDMSTGKPTATSKVDGGIKADYNATVTTVDPDTGAKTTLTVPTSIVPPLKAGTDITVGADGTVGVDETALGLKFLRKNTTDIGVVPVLENGVVNWVKADNRRDVETIVRRDRNGTIGVTNVVLDGLVDRNSNKTITGTDLVVNIDPSTNKINMNSVGDVLAAKELERVKNYVGTRLEYNGLSYIRVSSLYATAGNQKTKYISYDLDNGVLHTIYVMNNTGYWVHNEKKLVNTYLHKVVLTTADTLQKFSFTLQSTQATAYTTSNTTALGKQMAKTSPLIGTYTDTSGLGQLAYLVQGASVTNWKLYMYNGDLQLSSLNLDTCLIGDTVSGM